MATWKTVHEICDSLPETAEGTSYGTPAFKVKGKGMLRLSDQHGGPTLVIHTTEKEALLGDGRGIYFTTPHYDGYPMILVDLAKVGKRELRELIVDAWRMKAPPKLRKEHPEL